MLFYDLVALLALGTVFVATYTDLKGRIIPNKLTFPMIVLGIALYLGYGAYQYDWIFAIRGGLGAGGAFAMGYGMWYIGGWAGGDVKLYTALGALLAGYSGELSSLSRASYLAAPYPFVLTVLLNGIICLAPVLFGYVIVKSIQTPGIGKKIIKPIQNAFPEILVTPFAIVGGSILGLEIAEFFTLGGVVEILIIIFLIFLIYQIPFKFEIPVVIGLVGYGFYQYSFSVLEFLGIAFAVVLGLRLLISTIKIMNREVLQEEISIDELKEGMIPAETIYEKNGEVHRHESPDLREMAKRLIQNPDNFRLKPESDKVLADSSLAAGVSRYQVGVLRRHVREERLEDHIRIKSGLPFAPSFALGVPIAIFLGDIYWKIVLVLS